MPARGLNGKDVSGMAEDTNSTADAGDNTGNAGDGFKAPASQAELDRIVQSRLERERAKFADYDELKARAEKVSELEESSKSELQKAQERAEAAERALSEVQSKAVRAEVAAAKGVPVELLTGDSKESLEASADAILAFRDQTARKGNYAPSEGRSTTDSVNTELRDFTRRLFANND